MCKTKVIILGSCVSRISMLDGNKNGHGIAADDMELCYFLDKQNIALAMMPPAFSKEEVSSVTAAQLWDKSRIKTVRQSLNKDTVKLIMESDAEYLIMDLFDFQTNFAVLGTTAFDTNAYEFMNTILFKKYQKNIRVSNFMELPEWIYYPYVDLFFKEIMKKYDSEHIILNRFRANTYYLSRDGKIKEIPDNYKNPYQANDKYNVSLRKLEEYIITKYKPYVIDLSKFYMGDENVWSNLQGAHFEKEFYHETLEIICHIIRERPEKKIWDRPDFFCHKYDNDDRKHDIDRAFNMLEELVEKEDVLWINILEKLYRRIPENSKVKEYTAICMEQWGG
ncbi:MAG: hypothetical protein J6C33_04545 [Lachnospiraceae bacterium]|nr:hypothetical protein [Lachnospiraceae bacterium]